MRLAPAALLCLLALCAAVSAQTARSSKTVVKEQPNSAPTVKLKLDKTKATLPFKCGKYTSPLFPEEGAHIYVNAEASDPEGEELTYRYAVSGGNVSGSGAQVDWDLHGLTPGIYQISVTVKDKHAHKSSDSASVELNECGTCDCPCPTIILSGPNEAVEEGQPVTITANIAGGDPDLVLSFQWSASAGRIMAGQETSAITVDTEGLGDAMLKVTLKLGGLTPPCTHEFTYEVKIRRKSAQ